MTRGRPEGVTVGEILNHWPRDLTYFEVLVLIALAVEHPEGGAMRVDFVQLARHTRTGRRRIRVALGRLVERGYLRRLGRNHVYVFVRVNTGGP